jgi:hypothetical protein
MAAEKRADPRFRAYWPVRFVWEGGYADGLTENLSRSGAKISIEEEPPVYAGEEVSVTVALPGDGDDFEVVARIRWVDEDLPNTIGLAFDEPLPDEARTLLDILCKVESRGRAT